MLWIVKKEASHQIMSCNVHEDADDKGQAYYQLWITRPNGKNLKIEESYDEAHIREVKEAIDYAIEQNERALRLA